ncbi:MAG: YihY/virulence factor BrkB family protein [Nocardioides sp.]
MASLKERGSARLERLRAAHPGLDHVLRMVKHYGEVNGNAQAGAVTYFGFLSFFPILALAFVVVGVIAHVYPDLRNDLKVQVDTLLPGVVGNGKGEIPITTFEQAAGGVGVVSLLVLLYSGLGWLSGMRSALEVMFAVPRREQPGLLRGKLLDLGTLVGIGGILLLSVGLSTLVTGFSSALLGLVGIDAHSVVPHVLLGVVAILLAAAATSLLLVTMFKLLVDSHVPRKALWEGALLGAVGFEVLKAAAGLLLGLTQGQSAFQAFGVALILLVWINYFSRLVMYSAAYAYTAPEARARRAAGSTIAPGAALTPMATVEVPTRPKARAGSGGGRPGSP